jgi:hypothetical protein
MRKQIDLVGQLWRRVKGDHSLARQVISVEHEINTLLSRSRSSHELNLVLRRIQKAYAQASPEERNAVLAALRVAASALARLDDVEEKSQPMAWCREWLHQCRTVAPSLVLFSAAQSVFAVVAVSGIVGAVTGDPLGAAEHGAFLTATGVTAVSAAFAAWATASRVLNDEEPLPGPAGALLVATAREIRLRLRAALSNLLPIPVAVMVFTPPVLKLFDHLQQPLEQAVSAGVATAAIRLSCSLLKAGPPDDMGGGEGDGGSSEPGPDPSDSQELHLIR